MIKKIKCIIIALLSITLFNITAEDWPNLVELEAQESETPDPKILQNHLKENLFAFYKHKKLPNKINQEIISNMGKCIKNICIISHALLPEHQNSVEKCKKLILNELQNASKNKQSYASAHTMTTTMLNLLSINYSEYKQIHEIKKTFSGFFEAKRKDISADETTNACMEELAKIKNLAQKIKNINNEEIKRASTNLLEVIDELSSNTTAFKSYIANRIDMKKASLTRTASLLWAGVLEFTGSILCENLFSHKTLYAQEEEVQNNILKLINLKNELIEEFFAHYIEDNKRLLINLQDEIKEKFINNLKNICKEKFLKGHKKNFSFTKLWLQSKSQKISQKTRSITKKITAPIVHTTDNIQKTCGQISQKLNDTLPSIESFKQKLPSKLQSPINLIKNTISTASTITQKVQENAAQFTFLVSKKTINTKQKRKCIRTLETASEKSYYKELKKTAFEKRKLYEDKIEQVINYEKTWTHWITSLLLKKDSNLIKLNKEKDKRLDQYLEIDYKRRQAFYTLCNKIKALQSK